MELSFTKSRRMIPVISFALLMLGSVLVGAHYRSSNLVILLVVCTLISSTCFWLQPVIALPKAQTGQLFRFFCTSFVGGICLEFLTLVGSKTLSPFAISSWNFASVIVLFYFLVTFQSVEICFGPARRLLVFLRSCDKKRAGIVFGVSVGLALALSLLGIPLGKSKTVIFAASLPLTTILGLAISFGRSLVHKPQLVVFAAIVAVGLSIIAIFPVTNLLSWDDEVHYWNANGFSYLTVTENSKSDRMITELFHMEDGFSLDASLDKYPVDTSKQFNRGSVELFASEADENDTAESIDVDNFLDDLSLARLGYVPSALGLWIGRLLHLSFSVKFVLGKVSNLVFYALICALAVKLAPCKKCVMAMLALIPSSVLMAANYSYDPWVSSFSLLGLSLLLKLLVEDDFVNPRLFWASLLAFAVGFTPKAVYFPLFGLFLLIPWKKFTTAKQRHALIFGAIFACALLVVSFVLPYLSNVASNTSDARGGAEVSTAGQTYGVLANPIGTLVVVTSFTFGTYLNPANLNTIATSLAYLGNAELLWPWLSYIPVLLFVTVCLIDNDEAKRVHLGKGKAIWSIFLLFATCYLIVLALYISFTAVGSETVAGVQPRYLIPLVMPFSILLFNVPVFPEKRSVQGMRLFMILSPVFALYVEMLLLLYLRF